jgi:flotillin
LQQLLDRLPEIAAAVAQPLAQTDRIVIINSGGDNGNGGIGASRLTQDIMNVIAQMPEAVEALTGIDLIGKIAELEGFENGTSGGNASAAEDESVASDPVQPEN